MPVCSSSSSGRPIDSSSPFSSSSPSKCNSNRWSHSPLFNQWICWINSCHWLGIHVPIVQPPSMLLGPCLLCWYCKSATTGWRWKIWRAGQLGTCRRGRAPWPIVRRRCSVSGVYATNNIVSRYLACWKSPPNSALEAMQEFSRERWSGS
jgi:hypothetical protein